MSSTGSILLIASLVNDSASFGESLIQRLSEKYDRKFGQYHNYETRNIDFSTKYYISELSVIIGNLSDIKIVKPEALCVKFNGTVDQLNTIKENLPYEIEDIGIVLLVCENASALHEHVSWCYHNSVELIEMEEQNDSFSEDLVTSDYGFKRIHAALSAHQWSSLTMKLHSQSPGGKRDSPTDERGNGDVTKSIDSVSTAISETSGISDSLGSSSEAPASSRVAVDWLLGEEELDGDLETFGNLFRQFSHMKTMARSATGEDRLKLAENVVTDFWRAIDGEADELESSDDSDCG